ncbi:MAG: flagellar protein FlgN [Phycisphaerales bacterium]|nr:flagellar protein FlgN [Phycisphaerales bacterium]MCB9835628.1 flagellar protein FlgN [Phycisphaera sp.]
MTTTQTPIQTEPLEHTLVALAKEHETLIELAKQHRQALRKADSPTIARLADLRNQTNQRIIALDKERARIVAEISKAIGLPSANTTIRALIAQIGGPSAKRLSLLAEKLRQLIESARTEQSALREATAAFAGHLGGMLAQVVQTCNVAKTYNARGKMAQGIAMSTAVDFRH